MDNRKRIALIISACFLFLFAGLPAKAQALSGLTGFFLGALVQFFGFFIAIIGTITGLFLALANTILNFVLSPNFISLCYTCTNTDPAKPYNPIVAGGWELTRGLANIIFVLALLAIGLGTALRLTGYQAQKTLPLLILIALLINFTPVLLGIIVDATNIAMNFFLSGGFTGGNVFSNNIAGAWGIWWQGDNFFNPAGAPGKLIGLLTITLFNILAGIIFLLFAVIFAARYVFIWFLVILSPLAFAAYILPATRKWWTMWWDWFIQWSIIGVFASFFLYLSGQAINLIMNGGIIAQAPNDSGLGLLNYALPWGVALIFLFVGFMLSMSTSAMGSGAVMKFAKGAPKAFARTRTGQKVLGGTASGTQRALAGTAGFMSNLENKAVKRFGIGGRILTPFTRPFGWMNRAVGPALTEYAARAEKVPLPPGFESWSGPKQAVWAEAQGLSGRDTLRVGQKMGEKLGDVSQTNPGFQDKVKKEAASALLSEDATYQEEGKAIAKVFPEIMSQIDKQGISVFEHMKMFGKTGTLTEGVKKEALDEARKDIEDTRKFIKSSLTQDELTIEVAVANKIITRAEANALGGKITPQLTADLTKFAQDNKTTVDWLEQDLLKDTAAEATYVREFKSGDIAKMATTKTLGSRVGLTLGNPGNIQRIIDEHGRSALDDLIHGPGGLDSMTYDPNDPNNPKKLNEFYKKNQGMIKRLFNDPAFSHIDFKGKDLLLDAFDQKTTNLDAHERRIKILDIIGKSDPASKQALQDFYDNLKEEREAVKKATEIDAETKDLAKGISNARRMNANPAQIQKAQTELNLRLGEKDKWEKSAMAKRGEIRQANKNAANNPDLKTKLDEIESLTRRQIEGQGRRRRRP